MPRPTINNFSAILLSLLLILTAWGNAYGFFVFGLLSLIAGAVLYRSSINRIYVIAVSVSVFVAILSGLILFFRSR